MSLPHLGRDRACPERSRRGVLTLMFLISRIGKGTTFSRANIAPPQPQLCHSEPFAAAISGETGEEPAVVLDRPTHASRSRASDFGYRRASSAAIKTALLEQGFSPQGARHQSPHRPKRANRTLPTPAPKGRPTIAQDEVLGKQRKKEPSPAGTAEDYAHEVPCGADTPVRCL